MRRFDGAVNWPEKIHIHTQTQLCRIWSSMYNLFNITSSYLYVAVSKKRAAVLKLLHLSQIQLGRIVHHRLPIMSCLQSVFRGILIRCFSAPISLWLTPRKITLLKYKSRTEQWIRCEAKMSLCQGHLCLVWWRGELKSTTAAKKLWRGSRGGGGGCVLVARLNFNKIHVPLELFAAFNHTFS